MVGLEKLIGGLVKRIETLERQIEHVIDHCNKTTDIVQRHDWEHDRLKELDKEGKLFDKL